jgi:hypothetical protein
MREICTSGSVGGEGGNILAYLASFKNSIDLSNVSIRSPQKTE